LFLAFGELNAARRQRCTAGSWIAQPYRPAYMSAGLRAPGQ
jgi:hypothetical protein